MDETSINLLLSNFARACVYGTTEQRAACADAIRSLALLAQQPEAVGWQPISTAPKKTMLLLAAEFDRPGDWRIKTGYFCEEEQAWRVFGASWEPTRWMHQPQPPKDQEA
jgi:hypothetical protein